jgi:hypothetical protein
LPIGAAADLDYDLKGTIWTLGGAYRLPTAQGTTLDAVAGVRMLDIGQSLAWTLSGNVGSVPAPGRAGERHVDLTHWDAFVGLRGRTAALYILRRITAGERAATVLARMRSLPFEKQ